MQTEVKVNGITVAELPFSLAEIAKMHQDAREEKRTALVAQGEITEKLIIAKKTQSEHYQKRLAEIEGLEKAEMQAYGATKEARAAYIAQENPNLYVAVDQAEFEDRQNKIKIQLADEQLGYAREMRRLWSIATGVSTDSGAN